MSSVLASRRRVLASAGRWGSLTALALLSACGGSSTGTTTSTAASSAVAPSTSAAASSAAQASAAPTVGPTAVPTAASSSAAATSSAASSSVVASASSSTPATSASVASSSAAATSSSSAAPSAAASVQASTGALRFLWVDTGQKVWQDAWKQMFDGFTAANNGIKLQLDTIGFNDASQKALTTVAGGGYYDYLYGYFGWLSGFVEKQVIQPLDQFLAKETTISAADFYPAATEHYKGKLYGLAWFTNGKEIWYNADLFKAGGVQTPKEQEQAGTWTWQALLDAAQKLTKQSGDKTSVYGYDGSFTYLPNYYMHMWAWGGAPFSDDFQKATFDAKPQTDALQFAGDMVTKYKVAGGGDFLKSGLAMQMTGSFFARTVQEKIIPTNPFTVEMAPLPKGPTGDRPVALANNCNYIGAAAKQPEAAWALNKYLLSDAALPQIAQLGGSRYVASKKVKPITQYAYEDANVYAQSLARSRAIPLIIKESDLEKTWTDDWKSLSTGKLDVQGTLTDMQQKATIALQQGGCVC